MLAITGCVHLPYRVSVITSLLALAINATATPGEARWELREKIRDVAEVVMIRR